MLTLFSIRSEAQDSFKCLVCMKDHSNKLGVKINYNSSMDVLICAGCDYSTHLLTPDQKRHYLQAMRIQNEVKDAA